MSRSFVGFGFGPIQSGLFVYEAFRSGKFSRLVVAEVDERLIQSVRNSGGRYCVNIALEDRIEKAEVAGVEIYNPGVAEDRARLVESIRDADELATALPSVDFFTRGGLASVVELLCAALKDGPTRQQLIYTAENHNHAAEILRESLTRRLPAECLARLQIVNTVIGKMSGVITDPQQTRELDLATLAPSFDRAILVEAFNRILISQVRLDGFVRGIDAFIEKPNLLPFEEAKLFGHNAVHALIGYLANERGLKLMSEVAGHDDILKIAREAFINESGAALTRKYASLNDELFTAEGFARYADDLLHRMMNANLQDLVSRVIRDPQRKLGYEDRLFGTMRLALSHRIRPVNLARGAAAALRYHLGRRSVSREQVIQALAPIWGEKIHSAEACELIDLVAQAS